MSEMSWNILERRNFFLLYLDISVLSLSWLSSGYPHAICTMQEECEEKLAVAMPAMNAAISALDTLKQNDISIVKAMTNPPSGVKLVMESVCIMKVRK